jgi:hypothetical protein
VTSEPKVLIWDVETTPILAYVWGYYDQNVLHVVEDSYFLSVAYKWLGDKDVTFLRKALPKGNDKTLIKEVWHLLDEADIVVAHNGDKFDQKKANTRFLKHRLGLPTPYVQIDTLKEYRRHFNMASYKLNEIARFLELGGKVQHAGITLWFGCMDNDEASWSVMKEYNVHDVELLEDVWLELRPYTGHPGVASPPANMQQWTGAKTCTKIGCGSDRIHKRGVKRTKANAFQVYQCNQCGGYSRALLADNGSLR